VSAARIAEASLADTLEVVAGTPATRHVLALDGQPGAWLPAGFEVVPQHRGDLAARLQGVFDDCFAACADPVVVIGMDTPQVTSGRLERAAARLDGDHDAVLGPAPDGGYWLIGLAHIREAAFHEVAMSTASTFAQQQKRLEACGYRVARTETLRDVDTISDAALVAREAPGGRYARAVDAALRASAPAIGTVSEPG
jgi:glycosyltransferase A (GT-A) superfamily protein (DUF2064 family)